MYHFSLMQAVFLFISGVLASVVDTIGGGGGMITLPSLLNVGISPASAIGTNRLQSAVSEVTSAYRFFKNSHIKLLAFWPGFLMTILGSLAGAFVILRANPQHLMYLIPWCLLAVFVFFIISPTVRVSQRRQRWPVLLFLLSMGLCIGFYNGVFGPATGSLWILALMYFLGYEMDKAVMQAKPFNTAGNLAAFAYFAWHGKIAYWTLFVMAPGQVLGASLGAWLVMHHGTKLVRPVFITMFSLLMIKLFWSAYG